MGDVSVDEIIDVCPYITNPAIEYLEHFLSSLQEFEKEYMGSNISNSTDFSNGAIDIQQWQKDYMDNVNNSVSKNVHYLQKIEEETEQQKILQANIVKDIAKNKKEIEFLEGKILNIKRKMENLMNIRDEVQICKLLTNTTFTYKGSIISGYIVSKQINCFELDPEKLSSGDIINYLYNLIKNAFCDAKQND